MKCNNCGFMNVPGVKVCQNCGAILDMEQIMQDNRNKKIGNLLSGLSLVCMCFSGVVVDRIEKLESMIFHHQTFISILFQTVGGILPIVGIGLMVYVRVKYPTNTFGKVLMWLYIIGFIALLALFATSIIACGIALKNCGSIG